MKKVLAFIFLTILFFSTTSVLAVSCEDRPAENLDQSQLEKFWNDVGEACRQQLASNRSEQGTLKQAISSLNAKINLAQAQINQTNAQIKELEKEIVILEGVLVTVNESMDDLSVIYLARVRESYRRSRVGPVDLIFTSNNFADFFTRIKYLNTIKAKDQLILMELEKSRLDYDARKQEKITKQDEVEKLKTKLITQQKTLQVQQKDKQSLLASTQNDEKKFQELLRQANAQIASFKKFTFGATPLSNQTYCDGWGCYYSQRDSTWFSKTIGNTTEILGEVGCLITSTAMVASHYGKSIKPNDIAASIDPFFHYPLGDTEIYTAYLKFEPWTVNGVTVSRASDIGKEKANEELGAGRPIIAGLNTSLGTHFVVLKGINDQGYIMNDPFMPNGHDKPFNETYSNSQIFRFDKVSIN